MNKLAGRFEGWLCIGVAVVMPLVFYLPSRRDGIDAVFSLIFCIAFLMLAAICFSKGLLRSLMTGVFWFAVCLLAAGLAATVFIGSSVGLCCAGI